MGAFCINRLRCSRFLSFVSLRVVLLPVPRVAAHFFDAIFGLPTEFVESFLRIAVASGDIACTARLDAVRNFYVVHFFEGFDDIENGVAMAGSEVVNSEAALAFDGLEGGDMACGEVANVDVVANASTVWGIVIVAKNAEFLADADCGLRDVGHEVVRNTVRVFANASARMSSNRVEVAEQHHVPFRVCLLHILEHFFEHGFGFAVGICAFSLGAFFGNRDDGRVAIDGCRRTKNDVLATVIPHGIEQYERGVHVVLVVFKRLCDGFANSFEARKVDTCVELVLAKDFVHSDCVTDICAYKWDRGAYEFSYTAKGFATGIDEVIDDNNGMTRLVKFNNRVASNITCATHDCNFHFCSKV